MNKTIRIRTTPNGGDKFVKFKLEQDFDFIEILSLKLSQEDVYSQFSADYGCLVGRVTSNNGGLGLPNAKVSIFIPISEEDKQDPVKFGLYPYESVNDKDSLGRRYNLLIDEQSSRNVCHTPVGTLSDKREVLDNDVQLEIHEKYYKFTTTTNEAGDYLIFGIPVGTYVAHMDVDLSDIGDFSQSPYDFINQGYSEKQFESYTKFKSGNDLDLLPQIKSSNIGVNIIPFWSGINGEEAGIARTDFNISYQIRPSALFMGSLFGDNEKNSVNKNCRARKDLGRMCDTVSGEGSIEMLRKKVDVGIERFDVNGGRVIDEDGTWNYLIPMNRDYVTTDEFGQLIPTEDITKGVPTTASVRFRIGRDNTGDFGRLRTTAKHLVPNNPKRGTTNYIFDDTSPENQFVDLKAGGIYTIRNYIQRFQATCIGPFCADNRNFIGLKDVDDCVGSKNPFPYNRVDTDLNPLYIIICIIITIITIISILINSALLSVINLLIFVVNLVIGVVNTITQAFCSIAEIEIDLGFTEIRPFSFLGFFCDLKIDPIDYISCLRLKCAEQDYAPGCFDSFFTQFQFDETVERIGTGFLYPDKPGFPETNFTAEIPFGSAGYVNCIAAVLAEALDVYEFDFYNDWINGTLYQFLLKYKTRGNSSKYCAYDCDDFNTSNLGENRDGEPDVDCNTNYILDTCVGRQRLDQTEDYDYGDDVGSATVNPSNFTLQQDAKSKNDIGLKDGVIKFYDGELYYAAETHSTGNILYATDITYLGQINECNIYDDIRIHPDLIPTTYLKPPIVILRDPDNPSEPFEIPLDPLLLSINCLGVFTDEGEQSHCSNIKLINEIGRELPNSETWNGIGVTPETISNGLIRAALVNLNTDDGDNNVESYRDFQFFGIGGPNPIVTREGIPQNNSFYFYFGTEPGKTALEKANNTYLKKCDKLIKNELQITADIQNITTPGANDGSIDLTVFGGVGPYTYNWVGPNSFSSTLEDVGGLEAGSYTVTVSDSVGLTQTVTLLVVEPLNLNYFVTGVQTSVNGGSDGRIVISTIQYGVPPYEIRLLSGPVTTTWQTVTSSGFEFPNLPSGDYVVQVRDTTGFVRDRNVEVEEPGAFSIDLVVTQPTGCFGEPSERPGSCNITINGGVAPYIIELVGDNGFTSSNLNNNSLPAGNYTVTVEDASGEVTTDSFNITELVVLIGTTNSTDVTCFGGSNGSASVVPSGGVSPYTLRWFTPSDTDATISTSNSINGLESGTYLVEISDSANCIITRQATVGEPTQLQIVVLGKTPTTLNVTGQGGTGFGSNENRYTFRLKYGLPGTNTPFTFETISQSEFAFFELPNELPVAFSNFVPIGSLEFKLFMEDNTNCNPAIREFTFNG